MLSDAQILSYAKMYILYGESRFVCHAIRMVGEKEGSRGVVIRCHKLEDWVCDMIKPYMTVDKWLWNVHGISCLNSSVLRDYRIQWNVGGRQ